ncbi:gamma-butyrobetaine hydroxylase-like domain-containing protein [Litorilituus lipolyticus]|uniref:DUF971 domain-containing protein n=1 Tax=Litorilituus lipolyticus TaxID=2491017 RepID=A0A502LC72_9GAMM|nr:gamma-butyrobetaine hydroxylase-like domain-containing protein [Litorilituus lipolyticus]TPH17737.1 DUF971 domain-containing protein [Litorilituus lipolyticus]
MKVLRFTLNKQQSTLTTLFIEDDNSELSITLPYEYIRVFSPNQPKAKGNEIALITHKKQVNIIRIESVAKHGSRFIFDDGDSTIYGHDFLLDIAKNHDLYWQEYLNKLKESGHSREAMIDFKQL